MVQGLVCARTSDMCERLDIPICSEREGSVIPLSSPHFANHKGALQCAASLHLVNVLRDPLQQALLKRLPMLEHRHNDGFRHKLCAFDALHLA